MNFDGLKATASGFGKPEWVPVLEYVADLRGRSVFPARGILPYEWENIGPGYCYGPAFGHWDLIHAVMRGPAWNSMTYWLARGCQRYGRTDAARTIMEMALDATAAQFARTGTVWEFYHPAIGRQEELQRKPSTQFNVPCREYLGHNALFAMARLWKECGGA